MKFVISVLRESWLTPSCHAVSIPMKFSKTQILEIKTQKTQNENKKQRKNLNILAAILVMKFLSIYTTTANFTRTWQSSFSVLAVKEETCRWVSKSMKICKRKS